MVWHTDRHERASPHVIRDEMCFVRIDPASTTQLMEGVSAEYGAGRSESVVGRLLRGH